MVFSHLCIAYFCLWSLCFAKEQPEKSTSPISTIHAIQVAYGMYQLKATELAQEIVYAKNDENFPCIQSALIQILWEKRNDMYGIMQDYPHKRDPYFLDFSQRLIDFEINLAFIYN